MATTKYKFDIFKLIEQIDKNNYHYILNLTDEELKYIQPFLIQRYFSSAPSQSGLDKYHLLVASDINREIWKCDEKKLKGLEASAKSGTKVNEIFENLAKMIVGERTQDELIKTYTQGGRERGLSIKDKKKKKDKKKCC